MQNKSYNTFTLLLSVLFFLSPLASADIRLPRLLSDGLVLQRDTNVNLWGWADEGEVVKASLDGKAIGETTTKNGAWLIQFASPPAGGPHTIEIKGKNSVALNDVYFGDVWVASGQSNMQTTMARVEEKFADEIAAASYPLLRQFTVPRVMIFDEPQADLKGGEWEKSTPETLPDHSAVAYFFGKKIHLDEHIPVGILSSNFGGSPAECWMNEEALKAYPEIYKEAKSFQDHEYLKSIQDADKKEIDAWTAQVDNFDQGMHAEIPWYDNALDHSAWPTLQVPSLWVDEGIEPMSGVVWFRKVVNVPKDVVDQPGMLRLGTIVDADIAYINGKQVGRTYYQYPPRRYKLEPGTLKPGENIITLRIQVDNRRGEFIPEKPYYLQVGDFKVDLSGPWYYQVANIVEPPKPRRFVPWNEPLGCFNAMLNPLLKMPIKGVIWYQGETNAGRAKQYETMFPHLIRHWRDLWGQGDFPFLYVQLANWDVPGVPSSESGWPELRWAQFKTLKEVKNTAMAVAIDVGEWNDLHPLDKKSVGERLALAAEALAYGKKDLVYSGPLFKSVSAEQGKLYVDFDSIGSGLERHGSKLGGFEIAGADGVYKSAKAKIKNDQVVVWSTDVETPISVRYAWDDSPDDANLYNEEGLPASPFKGSVGE